MSRKRGYIHQYALITLITVSIFLPLLLSSLKICLNIDNYYDIQDEIGILQLQDYLVLGYDIKMDDQQLFFMINNKEHILKQSNNNLILKPGTRFILHDIKNARFELRGNIITLIYERDNKEYVKSIWKY